MISRALSIALKNESRAFEKMKAFVQTLWKQAMAIGIVSDSHRHGDQPLVGQ